MKSKTRKVRLECMRESDLILRVKLKTLRKQSSAWISMMNWVLQLKAESIINITSTAYSGLIAHRNRYSMKPRDLYRAPLMDTMCAFSPMVRQVLERHSLSKDQMPIQDWHLGQSQKCTRSSARWPSLTSTWSATWLKSTEVNSEIYSCPRTLRKDQSSRWDIARKRVWSLSKM